MELGGGCSDQEGAPPLLNQLSTTVVCELLDLKQSSVTSEVNNMQGVFIGGQKKYNTDTFVMLFALNIDHKKHPV